MAVPKEIWWHKRLNKFGKIANKHPVNPRARPVERFVAEWQMESDADDYLAGIAAKHLAKKYCVTKNIAGMKRAIRGVTPIMKEVAMLYSFYKSRLYDRGAMETALAKLIINEWKKSGAMGAINVNGRVAIWETLRFFDEMYAHIEASQKKK